MDLFLMKGSSISPMKHLHLSQNWLFKQRSSDLSLLDDFSSTHEWFPATVPGTVHQDLLALGRIPDPFLELNENLVQWVGQSDWLYKCTFDLLADFKDADEIAFCFDGLDTFATAWLNGTQILTSDNMFVPLRVRVASLLHPGLNELQILFASAWQRGKELEKQYGERFVWNGDASRVYVRKAQYHYGWDWGPTLLTAGIWKSIRLESYNARIADIHCPVVVADDLQSAMLPVSITLETGNTSSDLIAQLVVYSPTGATVAEAQLPVTETKIEHTFSLASPQLWWPNGYGEQPLYHLEITLRRGSEELDRRETRLGLRRLQLVQHPIEDAPGTSFFFEINNTAVFCGGANWIPADSFTPRVTADAYSAWLQLAASANMTMLRVWGGGIYEDEAFYNTCDELGLLVWQDFMFACGLYPAHEAFQESIRLEAEAAVRRLRHHPSLVIWAGNNEDYGVAKSRQVYDPDFEGDFTQTAFPARAIYERLLSAVCADLDPTRPYWRGSPYGGADGGDDRTIGDQHIWSIWHGAVPYQDYPKFAGRFVSEFGMEAFPVMETIASFAAPEEFYPQSRTLDFHNKDAGGPRRIAPYLIENVRIVADLEGYAYLTQFVQSEALAAAYRGWRRLWKGPGREYTAGALVWQLNDCWPVTSWAIVDYYQRPKPAYYAIRRALAPFGVGLARTSPQSVSAWTVSGLNMSGDAELEVRTWTFDGTLVSEERRQITLISNQSVEQGEFVSERNDTWVVAARLFKDGNVVARTTLWSEPFKYLTLPDPEINIERLDANTLRVHVKRPAKGVWLSAGDGVTWSDNMLDLTPDDPQLIVAQNLHETEINVKRLTC
jgi:beta-mannosidase